MRKHHWKQWARRLVCFLLSCCMALPWATAALAAEASENGSAESVLEEALPSKGTADFNTDAELLADTSR